jgi:hypothetical protein
VSHRTIQPGGLRAFFERFESLSAASDVDSLVAMYAPNFMIAGPNGAQVVRPTDLVRAIPRRRQLLDSAGHRETALIGFEETPLTDRYSLVRVDWRWRFERAGVEPTTITLPSRFIVDCVGDVPQIVLYMNDTDVATVARERGLLPPTA